MQVFALHRAFAHREADVAADRIAAGDAERLQQHDLGVPGKEDALGGRRQGFAEVDAAGRAGADCSVRVGLRVDFEVVAAAGVADIAAFGEQIDRVADDVGGIVALAAVARVDDRAGVGRERDVAGSFDQPDIEVADRFCAEQIRRFAAAHDFSDEDALGMAVAGYRVERPQHPQIGARVPRVQHIDVNFEEVVGRADAALPLHAADVVVAGG